MLRWSLFFIQSMFHQISKTICGFPEKFLLHACQAAIWSSLYTSFSYCTIAETSELKQYCVEQLGSTYSNEVLQGDLPPGKCEYARGSYSTNICVDCISKMEGGVLASNKFLQCTASFHLPPSLLESFQDPFYAGILQLRESKVALASSACILGLWVQEGGAWACLFRYGDSKK